MGSLWQLTKGERETSGHNSRLWERHPGQRETADEGWHSQSTCATREAAPEPHALCGRFSALEGLRTSYARDPSSGPGLPGWSPPDAAWPLHTVPPACELRSESAQPLAGPASAAFTHRSTFSIYVQAKGYLWPPPNRKNKQTKSKPLDSNNMKYISIKSF